MVQRSIDLRQMNHGFYKVQLTLMASTAQLLETKVAKVGCSIERPLEKHRKANRLHWRKIQRDGSWPVRGNQRAISSPNSGHWPSLAETFGIEIGRLPRPAAHDR
jgi:hypothetical protein